MENKLFNKELIKQYLNQPSTKGNTLEQKLKNKRIYTLEELEPILSSTGYFTRNREENTSIDLITGDNKAKFLRILYYNICRKEIGGRYLEHSLEKSAYDPNFEIVVLFDNQFEGTELPETAENYESQNTFQSDFTDSQYSQSQNETQLTDFGDSNLGGPKRTILDTEYDSTDSKDDMYRPRKKYVSDKDKRYDVDNVVAFLIAQKGECKKYPNIYCVNLICSRSGERGAGSGQVLMGLFLYSIKENPVVTSKVGLLELAGGYTNVSGLASYSKLGFKASYGLYGEYCFSDYGNLPMSITIIEPQKIIDILVDGAVLYEKPALCSFSGQPDLQKFLGFLKNLYIFATLVPEVKRDDYLKDDKDYRYRYFYEELIKIGRSGRRLKTMIENLETGKNTMADYKQTSVLFEQFKSGNVGGRTRKNRKTRSKKTRSKKTRGKTTRSKKTRSKTIKKGRKSKKSK